MDQVENTQQPEQLHQENKVIDDSSSANTDSIRYEDGKIQKKIYGGDSNNSEEIYVHLIERATENVQTFIVNVQLALTLSQFVTLLSENSKIAINNPQIKLSLESQAIKLETAFKDLLKKAQEQKTQLYLFYDEVKAIIKAKETEIKYEPLTKYSFIDDNKVVKVYIELEGIGKLPKENITQRYLESSIEVKIHDYKGKNWIFAVPKTQCLLRVKQSKVIQKQNKLVILIAKNAQKDAWFSLYKVKCIGEKDD